MQYTYRKLSKDVFRQKYVSLYLCLNRIQHEKIFSWKIIHKIWRETSPRLFFKKSKAQPLVCQRHSTFDWTGHKTKLNKIKRIFHQFTRFPVAKNCLRTKGGTLKRNWFDVIKSIQVKRLPQKWNQNNKYIYIECQCMILKPKSPIPKIIFYILQWTPFKNDEKCFLFNFFI